MNIRLLGNTAEIREAFINRFVMSWEAFQVSQKDWIAKMAKTKYPITVRWYEQSFMWDKIDWCFPRVSMQEALDFLKEKGGSVLFMSEKDEDTFYQGRELIDFVAEADAHALADQIEWEWHNAYGSDACDAEAFLPDDLYVFDLSMKWCVVFTHETIDEKTETLAEGRYCIICKI